MNDLEFPSRFFLFRLNSLGFFVFLLFKSEFFHVLENQDFLSQMLELFQSFENTELKFSHV